MAKHERQLCTRAFHFVICLDRSIQKSGMPFELLGEYVPELA